MKMLFKESVQTGIFVRNGAVIKLDDNNSFKIRMEETGNEYVCYVEDVKGEFDIISCGNIPYDKNSKSFVIPSAGDHIELQYNIDKEYQECVIYTLKIIYETYKKMKVQDFYKNILVLPGYEHLKFVYYVKKCDDRTLKVNIINPYEHVMIEGKKGDFTSPRYGMHNDKSYKYPWDCDIKITLRFTFVSNTLSTVKSDLVPAILHEDPKKTEETVKCPLLYDIMTNNTYADVVLFSSTGKEILSYRCILAKYSTIFKTIFDDTTELPVQIKIDELDTETIKAALEFCYGKADAIIGKEADVFKFAEKYEIHEIKEACCKSFENNLSTINVCSIIEIAYSNNFEDLKEKCKIFLARNKEEIEFDNLPKKILIDVLKAL